MEKLRDLTVERADISSVNKLSFETILFFSSFDAAVTVWLALHAIIVKTKKIIINIQAIGDAIIKINIINIIAKGRSHNNKAALPDRVLRIVITS